MKYMVELCSKHFLLEHRRISFFLSSIQTHDRECKLAFVEKRFQDVSYHQCVKVDIEDINFVPLVLHQFIIF